MKPVVAITLLMGMLLISCVRHAAARPPILDGPGYHAETQDGITFSLAVERLPHDTALHEALQKDIRSCTVQHDRTVNVYTVIRTK